MVARLHKQCKKIKPHSVHLHHMKSNNTEVLFKPNTAAASAPAAIGLIRFDDVKCGREVMSLRHSETEGQRVGAGKLWKES